jgi:hypothetical protein
MICAANKKGEGIVIPFWGKKMLRKKDIVLRMSSAWLIAFCSIPAFAANWTTFQDPNENAFTVEVPQGWTVNGGMFRMGYSDYRPMVDLRSPDGKVNIRLGDVSIPSYSIPNQNHSQEGSTIDLGAQAQLTVARYRSGKEYAPLYARVRFKDCKSLTPQAINSPPPAPDQPELAEVKQTTTGEVSYSCDGSRTAYVYSKSALYGPFWQVHALWSFEAPSDQVLSARAIIEHAVKSYRLNDAWIQHQKQLDQEAMVYQKQRQQARMRQLSQQVAQFEASMQAMRNQVASFEHRMQQQSDQVESFTRTLRGVTATVDPLGNPHEVSTGPKSGYYTDGAGHYVNAERPPGPNWQPLTPVP